MGLIFSVKFNKKLSCRRQAATLRVVAVTRDRSKLHRRVGRVYVCYIRNGLSNGAICNDLE